MEIVCNIIDTGKRMKFKFKKLLKLLIAFILLGVAAIAIGVWGIISQINTKIYNQSTTALSTKLSPSTVERYSKINNTDLRVYNSFTEEPLKDVDQIDLNSEAITLSALMKNRCRKIQCIQEKLSFNSLPSSIWRGLVGVEDSRFLEHKGVDFFSILRAIIIDIKEMRLAQGGSTLTQQLAKNVFLSNEKSFKRKIKEVVYAVVLESLYTKEQIIEMYLNESFWGSFGNIYIKGVGAASRIYFGKKLSQITEYEAAILIGMLKGPNYYHPLRHQERLRERTQVVIKRIKELNYDGSIKDSHWNDQGWIKWKKDLEGLEKNNYILNVYQTLNDLPSNRVFEFFVFKQSVYSVLKNYNNDDVAVKFLKVKRDCSASCVEYKYYSKIERSLDQAINEERHQVGSILKPIIYHELLSLGKSLDDVVSTKPITLELLSGKWTPRDSKSDTDFISIKEALQKSKNIPLIRTVKEVGFDNLESRIKNLIPRLQLPLKEYPAQLLGAIELSLSEVANLYTNFVNNLCLEDPGFIELLTDASQTTLSRRARSTIKETRIFGKTGTTNNGLDAWFIADDGEFFYVTWIGLETGRQKGKLDLYGAGSAFQIFQKYIELRGKQIPEFYCKSKI